MKNTHSEKGRGKMPNGTKQIHVTVTPQPHAGDNVPIHTVGTEPYVKSNGDITDLEPDQAFEITFTLTGAHGVNSFESRGPFGNDEGTCPHSSQGPSAPFSLKPGGNSAAITIRLDASDSGYSANYRLNYNDSLYTDPIIVVGLTRTQS